MKSFYPLKLAQAYLSFNSVVTNQQSVPKISNSLLLTGGTIIAFNHTSEALEIIRNGAILIKNDTISAIYKSILDITVPPDTEVVDTEGKIITPGFVNTHNHGWLTSFKTIGANTTLAEWSETGGGRNPGVLTYGEFSPANTLFEPEDVYSGMMQTFYESLNAGVTTIVEHASGTFSEAASDSGLQASIDGGARVYYAFAFHDLGKANYTVQDQMTQWTGIAKSNALDGTLVKLAIAYDRFSSAEQQEVEATIALAKDYNTSLVTAHCIGGPFGIYNSPELLTSYNFLNTSIPIILSHASFLTPTGAGLLRSTNQYISTCPESESFSGINHPYAQNFQDQASLGVDGQGDWSADVITQARLLLTILREKQYGKVDDDFKVPTNTAFSVNQAFLLATRHGGLALKRQDIGVISVGARADLVVFDGESPGMLGWRDPVEAVISHSNVGDVVHVLVNGRFVKRDRKMVGEKWNDVRRRFVRSAKKIQKLWSEMPYPVLAGSFLGGSEYGDTDVVDTLRGPGSGVGTPNLN